MSSQKMLFLDYIDELKTKLANSNLNLDKLIEIENEITNIDLLVPIVGAFSSGKSTLINSFLQRDILPTDITPETALATELHYTKQDEYIEAVTLSNRSERFELAEITALKEQAKSFKYIKIYLNNDVLKQIQPVILVDMPGFDAPIEAHNSAILNYLNRGIYFIFLTSITDGTITRSMQREIENLQQFGKGFTFCVSKTNLLIPSDVQAVIENLQEQLSDFDYYRKIVPLNLDGGKNLNRIIDAIDPNSLYQLIFLDLLKEHNFTLQQSINTFVATLKSSEKEVDKAIKGLEASITEIHIQRNNAITSIERRYSQNTLDNIIGTVSSQIINSQNKLIEYATQNQEYFNREINELIKNSLLKETKQYFESISVSMIEEFSHQLKLNLPKFSSFQFDENFVQQMSDSTHSLLKRTQAGLEILHNSFKNNTTHSIYKTFSTILGITTSVINPILEVVIIFLPEILSLFLGNKEEKQRQEQRANIQKQLTQNIIPEIQASKAQKQAALDQINQQITELENVKQDVIQLAKQYLFN